MRVEQVNENFVESLRLSASQVQTFVDCERKWAWRYVAGVEELEKPSQTFGKAVHAQLESYLLGGEIDFTDETGYVAASGLQHLPAPGADGLRVEEGFHFEGPSGHTYLGYKDWQVPGTVGDHKTTSDLLRWQKTEDDLREDVQATLYAVDYFRQYPDEETVELRWVYYQTRGTRKSAVTAIRVGQAETWERFLRVEDVARRMAVAATKQPLELPPNTNHCSAYGGCPHQGRCNLSPLERMRSHVEQNKLLSMLRKPSNGAPAAVPAAAPPPPAAVTPAAFAPGGAYHGTAAGAAPFAALAAPNGLLSRLQAGGAPTASPVPINPPEYQPPPTAEARQVAPSPPPTAEARSAAAAGSPAAPQPPAHPGTLQMVAGVPAAVQAPAAGMSVEQAGQELRASLTAPAGGAAPAAAAPAAARGRGRPKKAALPATGVAQKIDVLYVDCGPVGVEVVDAVQLIALAKKRVEAAGVADYRFAEYGQGPGMLAAAAAAELDALEGVLPAVRVDTSTPEGQVVLTELVARSGLVVR